MVRLFSGLKKREKEGSNYLLPLLAYRAANATAIIATTTNTTTTA